MATTKSAVPDAAEKCPPPPPDPPAGDLKAKLLKEIGEILKEFGGRESDIPVPHRYWDALNQFRSL